MAMDQGIVIRGDFGCTAAAQVIWTTFSSSYLSPIFLCCCVMLIVLAPLAGRRCCVNMSEGVTVAVVHHVLHSLFQRCRPIVGLPAMMEYYHTRTTQRNLNEIKDITPSTSHGCRGMTNLKWIGPIVRKGRHASRYFERRYFALASSHNPCGKGHSLFSALCHFCAVRGAVTISGQGWSKFSSI